MYTHSYSFNTDICLHIHSAECTVRLLNQAGRNNYPYNPKYTSWNFGITDLLSNPTATNYEFLISKFVIFANSKICLKNFGLISFSCQIATS